jgi:hypothetical protein
MGREDEMFRDEEFDPRNPEGLFGKRGITSREVVEGAFFPYDQGDIVGLLRAYLACGDSPSRGAIARSDRAPGTVMRRFPVPEGDPEITPEMRPEWAIITAPDITTFAFRPHHHDWFKRPSERAQHVNRSKNTPEQVARGCTPEELDQIRALVRWDHEWEVNRGGDHFKQDTDQFHIHARIAKYLFAITPETEIEAGPHSHENEFGGDEWDGKGDPPFKWEMYAVHIRKFHVRPATGIDHMVAMRDPDAVKYLDWLSPAPEVQIIPARETVYARKAYTRKDGAKVRAGKSVRRTHESTKITGPKFVVDEPDWNEWHAHPLSVKDEGIAVAKRLSSHPIGFARIKDANRVCFALEGCLKEAALVNAGEATFSCPSVTLWDAPELKDFAEAHLRNKQLLVICDSDWNDGDHEQVVRQTLLARDRLRDILGADSVHAVAPPETDCREHKGKHGVDDFLGHGLRGDGLGGTVDDLVIWDFRPRGDLRVYIDEHSQRRNKTDGLDRDERVLRWIIQHADPTTGRTRVALSTIAENLLPELKWSPRKEHDDPEEARRSAAYKTVKLTIHDLIADGIILGKGLRERSGWTALGSAHEWVGEIRLPDDLRPEVTARRVAAEVCAM